MADRVRIAVVAPANRLQPEAAARVADIAAREFAARVSLTFHPQCFLSSGHFAGDDAARSAAFLETANDAGIDAVWFARGGYGAGRIAEDALARLDLDGMLRPFAPDAVVRDDGGRHVGTEALRRWIGDRLAAFKHPRALYAVSALPRNALGKVQKHRLEAGSVRPD